MHGWRIEIGIADSIYTSRRTYLTLFASKPTICHRSTPFLPAVIHEEI